MTENRRIALNVAATYGRSLYALVCGLFTARWVLMSLGEVDYGLIGVVGGLIGFLAFFNGLMSTSVSRFYAFSVGQARTAADQTAALDNCCRWFNAAVAIHTVVPVASLLIGYPIGEWAVRHYLTIPPDRIEDCIWVFRITCLTCFVSMTAVPCHAMYTAKQEIAELTVYGFVTTTLNVVFLCYMVTHRADWFVRYAGWTAFLAIVPSLIITARAFVKYRECRIRPRYLLDWTRIGEMVRYAGCSLVSSLAMMTAFEGITVLVNRMLGPARNAAMTVGNSVCSHAIGLTGALRAAFTPAITNAMGAGDLGRAENLACRASVFTSLAVAVFAIPLCLEIETVLRIWLKTPPAQTGVVCVLLLIAQFVDHLTVGQMLSVLALKEIGRIQLFQAFAFLLPFPIAWWVFCRGGGLEGVGVGFVILYLVNDIGKLYFAKRQCVQSIRRWIREVVRPVCLAVAASASVGAVCVYLLPPSFLRVGFTTLVTESVFLPLVWIFVLRAEDRRMLLDKLHGMMRRSRGPES